MVEDLLVPSGILDDHPVSIAPHQCGGPARTGFTTAYKQLMTYSRLPLSTVRQIGRSVNFNRPWSSQNRMKRCRVVT